MNNAAFSNVQNLFSEPVNTICFAMKRVQSRNNFALYYLNACNPVIIIPNFIIIIHRKRVRRMMIPNTSKRGD